MHLRLFRKWIRRIYATQDEELDCEELFEIIPRYVDAEVAGEETDPDFHGVKHHLSQCAECYDLYLNLRVVAQLEDREVITEPEIYLEMTPPPVSPPPIYRETPPS